MEGYRSPLHLAVELAGLHRSHKRRPFGGVEEHLVVRAQRRADEHQPGVVVGVHVDLHTRPGLAARRALPDGHDTFLTCDSGTSGRPDESRGRTSGVTLPWVATPSSAVRIAMAAPAYADWVG